MYYLFLNPDDSRLIQLTFNGKRVATYTDWLHKLTANPDFHKRTATSGKWSTKDEWLAQYDFTLLAASPTPITPLTHPELLI
jgi:hypothetical protein